MRQVQIVGRLIVPALVVAVLACGPSAPPEAEMAEAEPEAESTAPPEGAESGSPEEKMPVEAEDVEPDEPAPPKPAPKKPAPKKVAPKKEVAKKTAPKEVTGKPVVVMETTKGTIEIELDAEKAPETVANFLQYVDDKFFDGTIFHRVMKDFMIQGGGFTADMAQKPTRDQIKNESSNGLKNERGTLAMARTSAPHSASSQFFINHGAKNSFLNRDEAQDGWGYCVFGKVTEGMDVVDAMAEVATGTKAGHQNVPVEPIVIESARRGS